jgi:hypothetical protein
VTVFALARLMGTSVAMIERHYGTLLEGAGAAIARRLSAFEAEQERAGIGPRTSAEGVWASIGPNREGAYRRLSAV